MVGQSNDWVGWQGDCKRNDDGWERTDHDGDGCYDDGWEWKDNDGDVCHGYS